MTDQTGSEAANDFGGFTVFELATMRDPYETYRILRARGGSVGECSGVWLVLGHEEATALLRSRESRSGFLGERYRTELPPGAARDEMSNRINFLDPPAHGRVRSLVSRVFTPRRVQALEPFIRSECEHRLAGWQPGEPFDLIEQLAGDVPAVVISELLGVPAADRGMLTGWSHEVAALLTPGDVSSRSGAIEAAEHLHAYLRDLAGPRRSAPGDDLLSALLLAEEDGERLKEAELFSLAATLYSAGHRTTRDLFGNGMVSLLGSPLHMDAYQRGELSLDALVEEFLRHETPTHFVARQVVAPLELGGRTIPAGATAIVLLAAGNRDPGAYADPERFDPTRWLTDPPPPAPLSFAFGAHFCLGASLARLEVGVMIDTVLSGRPGLRATESVEWRFNGLFRSVPSLAVDFDPAR